jgi:CO dehydrogenase maturation factor
VRIAMAGKGGAGKTTISATLARLLARSGGTVVGLDADSNPNLATALGLPEDQIVGALPSALVSRRQDGPALTESIEAVLEAYTTAGPDGVRIALMGMPAHAGEGCLCSAHATISAVLADLGDHRDVTTIVDLEASPEHLSRGTARHVDVLALVTEPYYRSLETTRRLARLASELPIPRITAVANKVRSADEASAVAEFCRRHEIDLLGTVPWSADVVDADVARVPLLDSAPDGEVVAAIAELAPRLLEVSPARG